MTAEELRHEARMVISAVAGLLLGRTVWLPPEKPPDKTWIDQALEKNVPVARELLRERLKSEADGVESVRRRSEFALTAVIAAVGLSAGAFERLYAVTAQSVWPMLIWAGGLCFVICSILIFAGVAVSKKVLGVVESRDFAALENADREELRLYVAAVGATSRTRRGLVTVFRDGFLIALLGLTLLATAHALSWTIPSQASDPAPVVINSSHPRHS